MNKKLTLIFTIILLIFCNTYSHAAFTTGKGRHTFKIDSFRIDSKRSLQSFLVGFGIDKQSSINIELTNGSDNSEEYYNLVAPYYKNMKGSGVENDNNQNDFYLIGPIIDASYQYIPTHPLFVTPDALNALEVGIKNLRGRSIDPSGEKIESVDRTYLVLGIISRSRWEKNNLFSDFHFIGDIEHNSWGVDTEVGYEYIFENNLRFHISYRYMASPAEGQSGFSLGIKTHY